MLKTTPLICIGLCVLASAALAGESQTVVARVGETGLFVRTTASAAAAGGLRNGNPCGSAINTAGVSRATSAVKVGRRVFLTGNRMATIRRVRAEQARLAATPRPRTAVKPAKPPKRHPEGLGTVLARIFGL